MLNAILRLLNHHSSLTCLLLTLSILAACDGSTTDPAAPPRPVSAQPPPLRVPAPPASLAPRTTQPPTGWISTIQSRIAASEYAFRPQADRTVTATNRAQGLRATWDDRGVRIKRRTSTPDTGPPEEVRLSLAAWGRPDRLRPAEPAPPAPGACRQDGQLGDDGTCLKRLEIPRDGILEYWENRSDGLEHSFIIPHRPESTTAHPHTLHITLDLHGATARPLPDEDGATFQPPHGGPLRYTGLRAWDADGQVLKATTQVTGEGEIVLAVRDEGARYPIVVDPLMTTAAWTVTGEQANSSFSTSVSGAGDVNRDGFSDVLIGASSYDNGQSNEGRAYLYLGGPTGVSSTPVWTFESDQTNAQLGRALSSAGDVNADGYSDVIIGAWSYDNGQTNEGRAYLFLGHSSGLTSTPVWTAESNQANAEFGYSISEAGDVNSDGFADVLIGAPLYNGGQIAQGRAFLYLGDETGLSTSPSWAMNGDRSGGNFGGSISSAGDVNGDGFSDVLISAHQYSNGQTNEGRVYLYLGDVTGLSLTPAWTAESDQESAIFGYSVSTAGDLNGDGFSDVIIGSYLFDAGQTNEGRAYVYLGSANGLSPTPAWTAESDQAGAAFGNSVAFAGDINGDGLGDVIVGSTSYDNPESNEGRVYAHFGRRTGLSTSPAWTAEINQADAQFGNAISSAGDVDGDGFSDVLIGADGYDGAQTNLGRAYVYRGAMGGLGVSATLTLQAEQASSEYAHAVQQAGDVNGDGYDDIIVGAHSYRPGTISRGRVYVHHGGPLGLQATPAWTADGTQDSAEFGKTVGSAGDVNGDGYSDVLIGAPEFTNGESFEGKVFLYLGGPTGLSIQASWTIEGNQEGLTFGISLASGDVNGDGFDDVIVGTGEELVFLYLGGAEGPDLAPAWVVENTQPSSRFGETLNFAGDVNGDGFGDIIIGAHLFDNNEANEGRAFLYLGGPDGLTFGPVWTAESDQADARFGASVDTAGDVNNDGYADVIIGAYRYSNGQTYEGRAYMYLGGADGLDLAPAWVVESDDASAYLGQSISAAGDVNGDGFGDVLVGAPEYSQGQANGGVIFVYLGGPDGLSLQPARIWEGDANNISFGMKVATAGDVNGDGLADVLGAAPTAQQIRLFMSNADDPYESSSRGHAFQPRYLDRETPVLSGKRSDDPNAFRITSHPISPLGRQRMKLQVETTPFGQPFNGAHITTSPTWVDPVTTGGQLSLVIDGLTPDTRYRWRARVLYDPSQASQLLASHWVQGRTDGYATFHLRTGLAPALVWVEAPGALPVLEGEAARVPGTLRLSSHPRQDVTVSFTTEPPGQVVVEPQTFTFTSANWDVPQQVTMTAVDDRVDEGDLQSVVWRLTTTSGDARFNGLSREVQIELLDDDVAGIFAVDAGGGDTTVAEAGATSDTFRLSLVTAPTAPVTLSLAPAMQGQVVLDATELTFTPSDWSTPQTVTVMAVDDALDEADTTPLEVPISAASADPFYDGLGIIFPILIEDNDTAGIEIIQSGGSSLIRERDVSSDTWTVRLTSLPRANVQLMLDADVPGQLTWRPASLTFTATSWNVPQTVTVTVIDDDVDEDDPHAVTLTHRATSADPQYEGLAPTVRVDVEDNDTVGIVLVEPGGNTFVREEGTTSDTWTVRLASEPTASVTVRLTGDAGQLTIEPPTLVFPIQSWSQPQTVMVTAINDGIDEEDSHAVDVVHLATSTDPLYNGISETLRALILDFGAVFNAPPSVDAGGPYSVEEGQTVTLLASGTDPESDPLTWAWDLDGDGVFDDATGLQASFMALDGPLSATVAVEAFDGRSRVRDSATVQVTNVAPRVTGTPPRIAVVAEVYTFEAAVLDPGQDTLTWELVEAPEGMVVEDPAMQPCTTGGVPPARCRVVTWTPTDLQATTPPTPTVVTLHVSDGDSPVQVFSWNVTVFLEGFEDSDVGGAPDECERLYGFDPEDPADDEEDTDGDGLPLALECLLGRDPRTSGAPTTPAPFRPADGAVVSAEPVTLEVDNATDPDGDALTYDFEVFDGEDAEPVWSASMVVEGTGRTVSPPIGVALVEDQRLRWRSRARDPYITSPWSEVVTFTWSQRNDPPPVPVALAPMGRASRIRPELVVQNAPDPEGTSVTYSFELYQDEEVEPAFSATDFAEGSGGITRWPVPADLEVGPTWRWRARATDAEGASSAWSEEVTFVVRLDNQPPTTPQLLYPADGAILTTLDGAILVAAASTDNEGDLLTYRFEVSTTPDLAGAAVLDDVLANGDQVGVALEDLGALDAPEDALLHWRVTASDGDLESLPATSTFRLSAENAPPGAVVLQSPADGGVVTTPIPRLEWLNTTDPEGQPLTYTIEVYNGAGTSDLLFSISNIPPAPAPAATTNASGPTLRAGQTYTWRARASDDAGAAGPWSEAASFTFQARGGAPNAPMLLEPQVRAVFQPDAPIAFRFAPSTDPDGDPIQYRLELHNAVDGAVVLAEDDPGELQGGAWVFEQSAGLAPGGYVWRVGARDARSPMVWSATRALSISRPEPELIDKAPSRVRQTPLPGGCGCSQTPRPASWMLLGATLLLGGLFVWRRRR